MNVAKKEYKVINITMLCPYYCCTSILGINIVQCHDDCTSKNWLLVAAKQYKINPIKAEHFSSVHFYKQINSCPCLYQYLSWYFSGLTAIMGKIWLYNVLKVTNIEPQEQTQSLFIKTCHPVKWVSLPVFY